MAFVTMYVTYISMGDELYNSRINLVGKEADGKVNYIQIYVDPMPVCSRCYR